MTTINDQPYSALKVEQVGRTFVVREQYSEVDVSGVDKHTIMFAATNCNSSIIRNRFKEWLRQQTVLEAARILNTSVGTVARIRKALGIRRS